MQPVPGELVETTMNEHTKLLLTVCVAGLVGCASSEDPRPLAKNSDQSVRCGEDQVAVCIDVDCRPEEFVCSNREDVREMFKAGDHRH